MRFRCKNTSKRAKYKINLVYFVLSSESIYLLLIPVDISFLLVKNMIVPQNRHSVKE